MYRRETISLFTQDRSQRESYSKGPKLYALIYVHNNEKKTARAMYDIVLSGGAINSPQLLMLSGVGNADYLKRLGVPIVAHLLGVGQSLQDHPRTDIQYRCKKPVSLCSAQSPYNSIKTGLQWLLFKSGLGTSSSLEVTGFIRSRAGVEHPDIGLALVPAVIDDHARDSYFLLW